MHPGFRDVQVGKKVCLRIDEVKAVKTRRNPRDRGLLALYRVEKETEADEDR